jgi:L-alanine-DL-glutamate epimerase-like enolase superfamily enzyme
MLTIRSVEAFCYRVPLGNPVVTSFGRMMDRPAVFVCIDAQDGLRGWGEVWCNFPSVGAEYRARLVNEVLAPLLTGKDLSHPSELWSYITARTRVLALQCGETGPFSQAIAGLDVAAWDLFARRSREPLWRLLGGISPRINVYASGINPDRPEATVERARASGHCAFKLKIGFDAERDRQNLTALRHLLTGNILLAADANQAWTTDEALRLAPPLEQFDLAWLEEPLRADVPWQDWERLAGSTSIPLAAGENISSDASFAAAISSRAISVFQPDVAKWGGITRCSSVARDVLSAGRRFCPHYLGGGIGLLASAHLLAAVGGEGLLEIDININPLRDACCGPVDHVHSGQVTLSEEPGLGNEPDLQALAKYRTL